MSEIKDSGIKVEIDSGELRRLRGYEDIMKHFLAQVAERGADPTIRRLVAENKKLKGLADIDALLASEE